MTFFCTYSGLVQIPLGAQRLFLLGFLEEERKMITFVGCLAASFALFPFRIALDLINRSIVLSKFVVPFFYFDSIIDTILVYLVPILINIAACKSMPVLLVLRCNDVVT